MTKEQIRIRVQEIFREIIGDEELVLCDASSPEEIEGWDSLLHITIMETIQDEFDIRISLDEMIELSDVGKIVEYLYRKKGK